MGSFCAYRTPFLGQSQGDLLSSGIKMRIYYTIELFGSIGRHLKVLIFLGKVIFFFFLSSQLSPFLCLTFIWTKNTLKRGKFLNSSCAFVFWGYFSDHIAVVFSFISFHLCFYLSCFPYWRFLSGAEHNFLPVTVWDRDHMLIINNLSTQTGGHYCVIQLKYKKGAVCSSVVSLNNGEQQISGY